jgi:ferredoxin
MTYVITQACIGVKDTACVGACPTDSIHGYKDSPQLYIDPATCIDCDACAPACPVAAIFPGDQVPDAMKKFIPVNADFFKSWDKSKSVAYSVTKTEEKKEGEAASTATGESSGGKDASWVEQPGWEAEWAKHQEDITPRVEEQKRYGRVRAVYEQADRFIVRFHLPENTPNHPFRFRYGLSAEMSAYEFTAELKNGVAVIRAKVADPKIAKLCGLANSFPDRFRVDYTFPKPVASVSVVPQNKHVVDVIGLKEQKVSEAA